MNFNKISLICLLLGLFASPVFAASPADKLYMAGIRYEAQGDYAQAIAVMEEAVKLEPDNAVFHHLLGRSYGQLADQSSWYTAMKLAIKTLKQFQKAVELDETNVAALTDLMKYYQQAPGIVGGDDEKAKLIEQKIALLKQSDNTYNRSWSSGVK